MRKENIILVETSADGTGDDLAVEISLEERINIDPPPVTTTAMETPPDENLVEATTSNKSKKNTIDVVMDRVTVFIPKVEPLKWRTFFFLSVYILLPALFYIINFTKMGYGLTTFYYLSNKYEQYAPIVGGALFVFLLVLYLLDFSSWDSGPGRVSKYLSAAVLLLGTMVVVLFMSGAHPYGPIAVFTILTPMWLVLMKSIFYPRKEMRTYICWLGAPCLFISFLALFSWLIWTFVEDGHEWNETMRLADAEKSGCRPDFTDRSNCRNANGDVCFSIDVEKSDIQFGDGCNRNCVDVFKKCSNSFIIWVGPLLVSVSLLFMSFFTTFLRSGISSETDIYNFGKLWLLLLFAMWVTASLAGAGAGVSTTLTAMTLASFISSVIFMAAMYNRTERKAQVKSLWVRIREKFGSYLDAGRALFIVTCLPIVLIYIFMSFLNQSIRRTNLFPCSKVTKHWRNEEDTTGDNKSLVTEKTAKQINEFRSWDTAKIFTYAVYWGIAFMIMNVVVSKFTILFLSWLIEKTSSMSLAAVTGILTAVGMLMFLLPPVPGVPIYLTLGIVVIPVGKDMFGYVGAMIYATSVSLLLKLLACTLQQKMIGEVLKGYVAIRQTVGINSKLIRSMRVVLAEKGLSIAKVSILVGGPDWPTSVLCGIMGLNLIPILLGTIPVVFLIAPTVLTGSFTYMSSLKDDDGNPEFPWASTVATMFAAFTGIIQFGSMISAAFYLEKASETYSDELEVMPFDEEVRESEEAAKDRSKAYTEVTKWHTVPIWAKSILCLSLFTMITCCYMVQIFQDSCFAEYALTYTITENLEGDWTKLVLPLGGIALLLFIISMVSLQIFTSWATRTARKYLNGSVISPESTSEHNDHSSSSDYEPFDSVSGKNDVA